MLTDKLIPLFYKLLIFIKENNQYRRKRLFKRFKRARQDLRNRSKLQFNQQLHNNMVIFNLFLTDGTDQQLVGDGIRYKRIWMKQRSEDHWNKIVLGRYTDAEWIEDFRISKKTFSEICNKLENELKPKEVSLKPRVPLSVKKQVAIALYKMASCAEYRVVGNVFGVHKSTVKKCLYRVVAAINKVIVPNEIRMPKELEAQYISQQFKNRSHIPQIIGCIDGTHVPIMAPADGYRDFVNTKGWASYNVQAIVDHNGRFLNVVSKHPGSTHDARVLKESKVYQHSDRLIPQGSAIVDGYKIPFMLIGDPAYPLLPWLLKAYSGNVSEAQESFNVYLDSARVSIEMAFGRLKGRWRMLLKRMDVSYKFAPQLIIACCALHNMAEKNRDVFLLHWMEVVLETEKVYQQPQGELSRERSAPTASQTRDHLMEYLARNFPLRQSILRR